MITYSHSDCAWSGFVPLIERLVTERGVRRICDLGGGANPSLSLDFVKKHQLDYTVLDISRDELRKVPDGYGKIQADATSRSLDVPRDYELVFSRMLAEHVKDAR